MRFQSGTWIKGWGFYFDKQIATSGSKMQRIAEVIQVIKTDLNRRSMRVEDLAIRANMSASSFHHHFKQVTSMSLLQYQKQLRLLEARRLMLAENPALCANSTNYLQLNQ